MGNNRDYKVTFVEARPQYTTDYGTFVPYALKLEGVDGYVQLSQKPETRPPEIGDTIHGHTYEQNSAKGNFMKFKKVNPEYAQGGSKPQGAAMSSEDSKYQTTLLEAIAKAVGAGEAVKHEDTILEDIEDGDPIDLSEIPF